MTTDITRKGTSANTGNAGHFAATARQRSSVSLQQQEYDPKTSYEAYDDFAAEADQLAHCKRTAVVLGLAQLARNRVPDAEALVMKSGHREWEIAGIRTKNGDVVGEEALRSDDYKQTPMIYYRSHELRKLDHLYRFCDEGEDLAIPVGPYADTADAWGKNLSSNILQEQQSQRDACIHLGNTGVGPLREVEVDPEGKVVSWETIAGCFSKEGDNDFTAQDNPEAAERIQQALLPVAGHSRTASGWMRSDDNSGNHRFILGDTR